MKLKRLLVTAVLVFCLGTAAYAGEVALTSIGQGPDAMMIKVLMRSLKVTPDYDAVMQPEALTDQKVLVAVVGGSSKGLGAAGIDKEQEVERTKALCEAAIAKGIKVLVMHVGGEGRRGTLSDLFINAVAQYGDAFIVVDGGNGDGIFNPYAEKKGLAILTAPNVKGTKDPLGEVLSGWEVTQ